MADCLSTLLNCETKKPFVVDCSDEKVHHTTDSCCDDDILNKEVKLS